MLTGRKLLLTLAFTALIALAAGVSCNGFFTNPTITSFTITPTNPTVLLDGTTQMYAWGTNDQGQQNINITSQASWSSGDTTTIGITTGGQLSGVALNTTPVTITATYEGLPAQTATANVCVDTGTLLAITPAPFTDSNDAASQQFTATLTANVDNKSTNLDVTDVVQWASTNSAVTIADGTGLATITVPGSGSAAATGTVTATYTCNSSTITSNTSNVTIDPSTS
jgi:hypothetical protein